LIGNAGPALWRAFTEQRLSEPDSLDAWTRRAIGSIAAAVGAQVHFPFDGPPTCRISAGHCAPVVFIRRRSAP
jgi:hypothetical protein